MTITDLLLDSLSLIDDKDKRKEIAMDLSERYGAWEGYIGDLDPSWTQIEKLVRNDNIDPGNLPWDGFVHRHIPVLSAKARAWHAYVCGPPTSASPYFVGTLYGNDSVRANDVEKDFYRFMRKAKYPRYFRQNVLNCGMYGKAIWRVRIYEEKGKPCFEYKAIRPRATFIYPNIEDGITNCLNVGHVFEMSVAEIKELQNSGKWFADEEPKGTSTTTRTEAPGRIDESESIVVRDEHKPVRVVECFDKRDYGEGEKWYRVLFCPDEQMLGAVYAHPYSRPWYFDMFLHEEQGRFWPETSRFNDVKDLQFATNEKWNNMSAGEQMASNPTTFTLGWALPQKYARNKPGTSVPIKQGGQVTQIQSRYDPSVAPLLLQDLDRRADNMFRMGAQSQGGEASYDKTATGAKIRKLSVDVAVNDDLANMDICMGEIAEFMQELYREHYDWFREAYGDSLAVQDPSVLDEEIMWEMNGKSPANTPEAQSEMAMGLVSSLVQLNPQIAGFLFQMGVDVPEVIKTLVMNSSLDNRESMLMTDEKRATLNNAGQSGAIPTEPGVPVAPDASQEFSPGM